MIEPGAVAIVGDRIVAVGTADELRDFEVARRIECSGKAVIPGLIDCHTHLFQGLARSLGEAIPLWPWLSQLMFPYASAMTREDAQAAALNGAVEAARAGTTCIVEHHYAPADFESVIAVTDTIRDVGIRGVVARGLAGPMSNVAKENQLTGKLFSYSTDEDIAITRACISARPAGSHVAVWPGPHNIVYGDQELIRRAVELARETGTGWHSHCSVRTEDPDVYVDAYGIRPIEWLHKEGLLGVDATIAHGIHLDDREIECLGESGSAVAYCPVSHQYGGCGVLRLRDLRNVGAVVGLGSDGPAYNHRQDLFECIKQAVLVQRLGTMDPTTTDSEEALELATREAARFVGIDAGSLAPGKLADVTVIGLEHPHLKPRHRTVATLAYSVRGSDVEMTIVGGKVIYEQGRCALVDEAAAMRDVQGRATDLISRAGLQRFLTPERTPVMSEPGHD